MGLLIICAGEATDGSALIASVRAGRTDPETSKIAVSERGCNVYVTPLVQSQHFQSYHGMRAGVPRRWEHDRYDDK